VRVDSGNCEPDLGKRPKRVGFRKTENRSADHHVGDLKDAKIVRNGWSYEPATTARFLRGKWARDAEIMTMRASIDKGASVAGASGKPYLILF
jgi:hypothetical protein